MPTTVKEPSAAPGGPATSVLRWLPDRRMGVAQLVSLGVHLLFFILVGISFYYRENLKTPPAAVVDVVEYQQEGTPDRPPNPGTPSIKPVEHQQKRPEDVVQPKPDNLPQVDVEGPNVDTTIPVLAGWDESAFRAGLAAARKTCDDINDNIKRSDAGGGDNGANPDSRGRQRGRWVLHYQVRMGECDQLWSMMSDLGLNWLCTAVGNNQLVYLNPTTGEKREGARDDESRFAWINKEGSVLTCESEAMQRIGREVPQVIWLMERTKEPELQRLERDFVEAKQRKLEDVVQTNFEPVNVGGRWNWSVTSCVYK